jgi:hypothetical protein
MSLDNHADPKRRDDVQIIDISQLGSTDDGSEIDTGVTSGADSSEWDPISVDDGRVDICVADGGKKRPRRDSSAPACPVPGGKKAAH